MSINVWRREPETRGGTGGAFIAVTEDVSSSLGVVAMPLIGFYCATKWAVKALHESLAQEMKPFGIKVALIEPGA